MRHLIFLLCFSFVTPLSASEIETVPRINIIEILDSYAKRTGTKFVADPRVKAKVRLIGLSLDEIDKNALNQILYMHAFRAYEKNGVVYILPQAVEKHLGDQVEIKYGKKWVEE